MFYFQFLIEDPARLLGAHGNTGVIKHHPFFESIDWKAVEEEAHGTTTTIMDELRKWQVLYSFTVTSFY